MLASFCHYQNGNWKWMSCLPLWHHRRRSRCCLHSKEADAVGLTLVYAIPDANNGEINSFHVFSKELNGEKSLWLTCWGWRGRELCAEYTINCLGPVAVETRAHRRVNVRSRLSTEERETFGDVGGLMSVNTDSAHPKLHLDLSAQHTNMWYFITPIPRTPERAGERASASQLHLIRRLMNSDTIWFKTKHTHNV